MHFGTNRFVLASLRAGGILQLPEVLGCSELPCLTSMPWQTGRTYSLKCLFSPEVMWRLPHLLCQSSYSFVGRGLVKLFEDLLESVQEDRIFLHKPAKNIVCILLIKIVPFSSFRLGVSRCQTSPDIPRILRSVFAAKSLASGQDFLDQAPICFRSFEEQQSNDDACPLGD